MLIINDHARQRYVKRVMGIENGIQAKDYANANKYEVTYKILELMNNSILLHDNYSPTRRETLDYYINGELLIKFNPKNNELESMYYISIDKDKQTNSKLIKSYVKKININRQTIRSLVLKREKQDEVSLHIQFMLKRLEGKIEQSLYDQLQSEFAESINLCKGYASEEKRLRTENREVMTILFKKN